VPATGVDTRGRATENEKAFDPGNAATETETNAGASDGFAR
jgi:hypothetical protein